MKLDIDKASKVPKINGEDISGAPAFEQNVWSKIIVSCSAMTPTINPPTKILYSFIYESKTGTSFTYSGMVTANTIKETVSIGAPSNSVNIILKYYIFSLNSPLAQKMYFNQKVIKSTFYAFSLGFYDSESLY